MTKKNPFVFTIGFDKTNPAHIRATEILNESSSKAQLIASAVLQYVGEDCDRAVPELSLTYMQPMLEKLIQKEVEAAMKHYQVNSTTHQEEAVQDLSVEEDIPIDDIIAKNVSSAISAFRNKK